MGTKLGYKLVDACFGKTYINNNFDISIVLLFCIFIDSNFLYYGKSTKVMIYRTLHDSISEEKVDYSFLKLFILGITIRHHNN